MNRYLLADIIITIASFSGLFIIANGYDPFVSSALIKVLFFSSALLAIIGLLIIPVLIVMISRSHKNKKITDK